HVDRTAVMRRALLRQISVLDHLLDIVGDVGAEIATAQHEFADGHLGITDIKQYHPLDVVDVVDPQPIELKLYHLQELPVKAFDQRDHFEIHVVHPNLGDSSVSARNHRRPEPEDERPPGNLG